MEEAEPGRTNRNHDKHTFHIPNILARVTRSKKNHYNSIPAGEDEEEDNNNDDHIRSSQAEEDVLTGLGVETSREWHSMTVTQRLMVRVAFGIFGAAVLLPL